MSFSLSSFSPSSTSARVPVRFSVVLSTLCLLVCGLVPLVAAAWQAPDGQKAFNQQCTLKGRSFHIYVPPFSKDKKLDLLLWCHPGDGKSKPEFTWWLRDRRFNDGKTVLLCPQAKQRGWQMGNDASFVSGLLETIVKDLPIATDRMVMGGHSSGAFFTYAFGLANQKHFAALLPAAGFATTRVPRPHSSSAPQICIYHSKNDQVVPWAKMMQTKQQLEKLKYKVDLTEDKVQHSIYPKLAERYVRLRKELREAAAK